MSHGRIAALINELQPMVAAGRVERNGMTHIAPLEFWIDGINAVLNARSTGTLALPLKSHGYLLEVIAKRATSAAARVEAKNEASLRTGAARREEERYRQMTSNAARQSITSDGEARQRITDLTAKFGKKSTDGMTSMNDIATGLLKQKPQGETK